MSVREIARRLFAVLCIGWLLWLAIWWFCRPVVLLHYAEDARESVVYFFNDNHLITKQEIKPGRVERFYTDLFPGADSFINVSLPFASRDGVEFKPPFSRVTFTSIRRQGLREWRRNTDSSTASSSDNWKQGYLKFFEQ